MGGKKPHPFSIPSPYLYLFSGPDPDLDPGLCRNPGFGSGSGFFRTGSGSVPVFAEARRPTDIVADRDFECGRLFCYDTHRQTICR